MYLDLGIYITGFEIEFLKQTNNYYKTESESMIQNMPDGKSGSSIASYLVHVDQRIHQESERATDGVGYLSVGSRTSLVKIVEKQLVQMHLSILLDKGFKT